MTTRRTPKPTAPPLADTLRAALSQGWHTLSALDALAPARGSSDARRAVHEALRSIKAGGCALEERVGAAGVEVRLVPIVDPGPIPGVRYGLSPEQIEEMGGPEGVEAVFAETGEEPVDLDVLQARAEAYLEAAEPAPALDADGQPGDLDATPICGGTTCPECERAIVQLEDHAPTCVTARRDGPWWDAKRAAYGAEIQAHVDASLPPGTTPQERAIAFAGEVTRRRREGLYVAPTVDEPPAPAEPAPPEPDAPDTWPSYLDANGTIVIPCKPDRPQEPGPSARCAVCNVRYVSHWTHLTPAVQPPGHPFTPKPRGRPRAAAQRLAAVQAADPDVEELPAASEQKAILDGAKRDYEAAVEEVREERAEPERAGGGSKETSDDATRDTDGDRPTGGAGLGPDPVGRQAVADEPGVPSESAHPAAPRPRKARTVGRPVESAPPAGVVVGRCRPPLCHADDIHEPSRVRAFQRPLCERHRAWVEGAGGSVRYEPKEETV